MALVYFTNDYEKFYNCTFYDYHSKPFEERSSLIVGWLYIITFFIIWFLYVPFIFVMYDKELQKHSCYKLMVYLAILDLNTSLYTGLWAGIVSITGGVYCHWPHLSYWIGILNGMAWKAQSIAIVLLAFNRCLEALSIKWSTRLFYGKKTYIWMLLPFVWSLHDIVFGPPAMFNPIYMIIVYNPHAGYFDNDNLFYTDMSVFFNNIFVSVTVPLIYGLFGFLISIKTKHTAETKTAIQTKVFGQIFLISIFLFMISVGFLIIQFIQLPPSFNPWLQYLFLLFDGQPAIIYLTLNATMRKRVIRLFCNQWSQTTVTAPIIQLTANNNNTLI